MEITSKIFESLSNTFLAGLLIAIISVSSLAVFNLSARPEEVQPVDTQVLGVDTEEEVLEEIRVEAPEIVPVEQVDNINGSFESLYLNREYTEIAGTASDDGYILWYKILNVLDKSVNDEIVLISNNTSQKVSYEISLMVDPAILNFVSVDTSIEGLPLGMTFDRETGVAEYPISLIPGASAQLNLDIVDYGYDGDVEVGVGIVKVN